jgi:ketosteroid isomerase-like protein
MSQENADVVRLPVAVRARSRRRLLERLALRFPRVPPLFVRSVQRLSPRSRLRQAAIRYAIRQGVEALNRRDFAAVFGFYDQHCEFVPFDLPTLGLEGTHGRDERIRFQQRWLAEWGEFRFEPEEVIDLADGRRLLLVGRTTGAGLSSGASFDGEWAALLTISAGWVMREEAFFNHAQALEAAGLSS